MKHFIAVALCVLTMLLCCSLATQAQTYNRKGNNFEQVSSKNTGSKSTKTQYTWTDSRGKTYPIYITNNGRCFINKVSAKSGKEYKYYLPKEVSQQIAKELGIKYKEDGNNSH